MRESALAAHSHRPWQLTGGRRPRQVWRIPNAAMKVPDTSSILFRLRDDPGGVAGLMKISQPLARWRGTGAIGG